MKVAFVTGILGQDGWYITKSLLSQGYKVWGMIRRSSSSLAIDEFSREYPQVNLRYGDLTDPTSLRKIISECIPDEVYNLGAQSHVRISYDMPEYTAQVNSNGVMNLLSAVKDIVPGCCFYQASTSEMFGRTAPPQNEISYFKPTSPYGAAKLHAYWEVINARQGDGLFACNGILFNHESPRRGENFVTKKITSSLAKIVAGTQKKLTLGNLDSIRDWGHAEDYVEAMQLIVRAGKADDFVVATGEAHTVREFLEEALNFFNIEYINQQSHRPEDEKYVTKSGDIIVDIDPQFYRPVEVDYLLGDSSKIKKQLGWVPRTSFKDLVVNMCEYDLKKYAPSLSR